MTTRDPITPVYLEYGNTVFYPYGDQTPNWQNPWIVESGCPHCGRPWTTYTVSTVPMDDDADADEKLAAIEKAAEEFKNPDWRKVAFELWKLLDNIDTASDMFKDNYEGLSKYVYNEQQRRHQFLSEPQVDRLYEEYYKPRFYPKEPVDEEA